MKSSKRQPSPRMIAFLTVMHEKAWPASERFPAVYEFCKALDLDDTATADYIITLAKKSNSVKEIVDGILEHYKREKKDDLAKEMIEFLEECYQTKQEAQELSNGN